DSANSAFLALINSPEIRKSRRIKLCRAFEDFQKNREEVFWTQRAIQVSTEVTTNEVVAVQRTGGKKAQLEYQREGAGLGTFSAVDELIGDSDNTGSDTGSAGEGPSCSSNEPHGLDDAVEDVEEQDGFGRGTPLQKSQIPRTSVKASGPGRGILPHYYFGRFGRFGAGAGTNSRQTKKNTIHGSTTAVQSKKMKKADEKFTETARRSLQRRHSTLGPKWHLNSGTVVEDVLLQAGLELTVDHPIRSFMIDLQDMYTESLFSPQDWTEIKSNLPPTATYSTETEAYLDTLASVVKEQDIISILNSRPLDPEKIIVYRSVESWCDLYDMDPSPFALDLSEDWWMKNAWNSTRLLAKAVPGSFIITGDITGIDSASRRNNKERHVNITPLNNRKRMGVRADMIWRTVEAPVRDWMIGEAARKWDENAGKYIEESTFKIPRQLHDILSARSQEVGGTHRLRNAWIPGLVFGGPVVQRVGLCWGAQGTNVTRLKRWRPARIYPKLRELSSSLNTIRQLLLTRAETLHLIDEYYRAKQEQQNQERAQASHHPDNDDDWRGAEDFRDLLSSSPRRL
ncbi:hypothetical protein BGX31_001640, partial [Mortierella sp. GBA43]